jgi:hypothetical protein
MLSMGFVIAVLNGLRRVGDLHLAVRADRLGRVARDHLAVDHHGDAVGDAEHRVHVVLDQQHRVGALERAEQLEHAAGLLGAHAGERLVEQQRTRARRQAHRDLELALAAVAERAGDALRVADEAGGFERLARRREARLAAFGRLPQHPRARPRGLRAEAAVLEHRKARVDRRALVAAADAGARAPGLRPVGDVVTLEVDAARGRGHLARQHVDQRRLAGAVGADHRVHLARPQLERDAADGGEPAEAARQQVGTQQRLSHGVLPAIRTGARAGRSIHSAGRRRRR